VLGAIYMLWMYQRVFLGKLSNEKNKDLPDLSIREIVVLVPIVVFMFWLGVRPGLVLDKVETSIEQVLAPLTEELAEPAGGPVHHTLIDTETGQPITSMRQEIK
jgi:NADH-quinone oxidoreductase subunit M